MTTTFENAKKGDMVFDYLFQEWGSVESVFNNMIGVSFSGGFSHYYFNNGTDNQSNKVPRLFWDEVPPIVAPSKPVEVPPVDTLVRVWDYNKRDAVFRYSAGKLDHGMILCWDSGATSRTIDAHNDDNVVAWTHWEIVND